MAINFDRVVVQIIAGAGFGVAAMVLSPHATAALEIGGQYSIEDGAGGSGKGALIGGPPPERHRWPVCRSCRAPSRHPPRR
ncbi:hypothetical protein L828_2623 [Mycobacteroides abscessus MAB_030201_1061]|nr:hypothetical protein L828_2623 [Mycobacteroides abscessus MAB_030201_1061]